jgi:hypothetical protein
MTANRPAESACAASPPPQPIATVRSYDDLRRAVADWCLQIGLTRQQLDAEAGLTDGHSGKLLSASAVSKFGNVTLGRVLAACGLIIVVAIDPDAPPRPPAPESAANGRAFGARNGSTFMHWRKAKGSAWGRRMAALRALKLSARQRTDSARTAAEARWHRPRTRKRRSRRNSQKT